MVMREKSLWTFARTAAKVIPVAPRGFAVGTFGVASASYCLVASGLCDRTSHTIPRRAGHVLVADDFDLETSGSEYRAALMVSFVLWVLQCPGSRQLVVTLSPCWGLSCSIGTRVRGMDVRGSRATHD